MLAEGGAVDQLRDVCYKARQPSLSCITYISDACMHACIHMHPRMEDIGEHMHAHTCHSDGI